MENPFKYSGIVKKPYFVDRENELNELIRETSNLNKIFLISPRRFGKTCLLFKLMDELSKENRPCAYLDLNACPDIRGFASAYTHLTTKALESNTDKMMKIFSTLKRLRPKASVGHDGSISASVDVIVEEKDTVSALLEGIENAEKIAKKKATPLTVIIDEFSDIAKYNGQTIEKLIRSEIQKHEHVAYIFSGSEQSIMLSMVQDKHRAFYKLGRIMKLGHIDKTVYIDFIYKWFNKSGYEVKKNDLAEIIMLGANIPYNIQRLCHNLWEVGKKSNKITPNLIRKLPSIIVEQDYPHYEMLWRSISKLQKILVIALTKEPSAKPFSKEFQFKYSIGPSSSIKASLESLTKRELLCKTLDGKYIFTDIFMPYWVKMLTKKTY